MLETVTLVFFPLLMAYAASSDLFTMTIPNRLSVLLVLGFPVLAYASGLGLEAIAMHLAAGAAMLAVTFTLFGLGWIGGGDAKLAAATAVWLGFGGLPSYLLLASLAGGALTLALLALRRHPLPERMGRWPWLLHLHDQRTGVPYGIALAAAALAVYPYSAIWLAAIASS